VILQAPIEIFSKDVRLRRLEGFGGDVTT